jgi:DNA-binding PadR family transcriptional regulator
VPPTRLSFVSSPLPPAAFLILVSLADAPSHGYKLRKDLFERSGGALALDPGSLYRLMFKLGEDGLIEPSGTTVEAGADDGRRRVYRLTRTGRSVLDAETARLASLVEQARAVGASRKRHA